MGVLRVALMVTGEPGVSTPGFRPTRALPRPARQHPEGHRGATGVVPRAVCPYNREPATAPSEVTRARTAGSGNRRARPQAPPGRPDLHRPRGEPAAPAPPLVGRLGPAAG